jgi:hypothetical protein
MKHRISLMTFQFILLAIWVTGNTFLPLLYILIPAYYIAARQVVKPILRQRNAKKAVLAIAKRYNLQFEEVDRIMIQCAEETETNAEYNKLSKRRLDEAQQIAKAESILRSMEGYMQRNGLTIHNLPPILALSPEQRKRIEAGESLTDAEYTSAIKQAKESKFNHIYR